MIADLKRLRRKNPARFKDCLDRVAALGHSPVRSLTDIGSSELRLRSSSRTI